MNKIYESKYGPYVILDDHINNKGKHKYVKIHFINTGYETEVRKDSALKGLVKDDLYDIDFTKTYDSKYGPYNIIEYLGRNKDSEKIVKIKFQISGGETISRLRLAKTGSVIDPLYGLDLSKTYLSNNYGLFKILNVYKVKDGDPKATIQFLNTGNTKEVLVSSIKSGNVRDDNGKVDYQNYTSIDSHNESIDSVLKSIWHGMMARCYKNKTKTYDYYGGIGVTVCDAWLDINTFINDAKALPQFDKFKAQPNNYRLDKDYIQLNIPKELRVYSKETCMFLSIMDNSNLRVIEAKRDHPERYSSKYYNVSKRGSGYVVSMSVNGKSLYLGTYYDEVVAAAVANYWQLRYHTFDILPLLNDVPPLDPTQFVQNRVNVKQLYRLVND